jgi:tripartite-type tricarboxylate transporter receptor subunit TctC
MVFFSLAVFVSSRTVLAAPYYEGKVLKIVVGFTPGGGYDRMARLLAKHLPKHIPGKPVIVVQNMEGASSVIASNYLYNIAKPDGLTIGTFIATLPFAQLLKIEGVKFDIRKYSWIGSSAIESYVLTLRTDLPYKTIEDLKKAKDPIPLGCSGVATMDYQFPLLLKGFIGLNFKMVIYVSSAEAMLGVEKKEVVGRAGYYSSLMPFIERGVVRPWIRGRVSRPGIENLPVNEDLTTDKTGKAIMAMFSVTDIIGRPYVAPPGTPSEIMNILREAFAKVAKDPQLKEDSKKMMMDVEYTPAEEVLKIINFLLDQPEDIVKEFSKYVRF